MQDFFLWPAVQQDGNPWVPMSAGAPGGARAKQPYVRLAAFRSEATHDLVHSLVAAAGDAQTENIVRDCARAFEEEHPAFAGDAQRLMKTTLHRLLERGDATDQPKPGRPRKVSDIKLDEFLAVFLRGNGKPQGKGFRGYASVRDAFKRSPRCRALKREMHISFGALWDRLKKRYKEKYGESIKRISLYWKPKLPDHIKAERLASAMEWLATDAETGWLDYAVWLDEKTEWLTTKGIHHCYAPPGMKSHFVEHDRDMKKQKVKYLAATSALMGALWFGFVAGTSGMKPRHRVRTVPELGHLDPPTDMTLPPCCVQNLHLLRSVLVADAQHAETFTRSRAADALVHLRLFLIGALPVVVLLAIQEHEQASAESSGHWRHLAIENDDVHADLAHLCTQANEGFGIMHKCSARLASNLHAIDVLQKSPLLN